MSDSTINIDSFQTGGCVSPSPYKGPEKIVTLDFGTSSSNPAGSINTLYYYPANASSPSAKPVYLTLTNLSGNQTLTIPGNLHGHPTRIFTISLRPGVIDALSLKKLKVLGADWNLQATTSHETGVVVLELVYRGSRSIDIGPNGNFKLTICGLWCSKKPPPSDYNTHVNSSYEYLTINGKPFSSNDLQQVLYVTAGSEGSGPCGVGDDPTGPGTKEQSKPGCLALPFQLFKNRN